MKKKWRSTSQGQKKNKRVFFPDTQVASFFLFFWFPFLPLKLCTSQTSLDLQCRWPDLLLQTRIVLRCVFIPAISVFLLHSLFLFQRFLFGGVSVVLRKGGGFVRRELWSREKAEEGGGGGAMEAVDSVVKPIKEFAKDSVRLVNRCHKPDRKGMLFAWIPSLRSFSDP
jgi:hypothetical protein